VDSGICSGQEISPFYDPMVAKIIACGPSRDIARLRLIEALKETVLFGTRHNRDFLVACLEKETFAAGRATTAFIAEEFADGEITDPLPRFTDSAVAAVIELALDHREAYANSVLVAPQLRNWASASPLLSRKQYLHGALAHDLCVTPLGDSCYQVFDDSESTVIELLSMDNSTAHVGIDDSQHIARYHATESGSLSLSIDGRAAQYRDMIRLDGVQEQTGGGGSIIAPMHGLLLEVRVSTGDIVKAGQTLAVLEAMKMHYEIVAEADGAVTEVLAEAGNQVAADDRLIEIEVGEAE
jgi:geranyl-CoA carboxylase alpha subunit